MGFPTQFDNSTRLGRQSVFKYCIDDGNEVFYSITIGDSSLHGGHIVYEDAPGCEYMFVANLDVYT